MAFFFQGLEEVKVPLLQTEASLLSPPAVPPIVKLYPEKTVEMGEPNILICRAEDFSPPVLKMTWQKNGQPVTEGVQTMDYYPQKNHAFRRFSYLPFVPNADDVYICKVEHWGLPKPLGKIWSKQNKGAGEWQRVGDLLGQGSHVFKAI